MTDDTKQRLRTACASFLKANDLKVGTKRGASAIHTFWYGALVALGEENNPWVTICLLSGRHDDLVAKE